MDRTSAFMVRRVLLGVIVGLTLLALCFFGWVQFRTSQYHHRESQMLSRYHSGYVACVRDPLESATCVRQLRDLCVRDVFWHREQPPFLIDLAPQFNTPELRCKDAVAG
jgi:hypothetical protein